MNKYFSILILSITLLFLKVGYCHAEISFSDESASLKNINVIDYNTDLRTLRLKKFFESFNSPLSKYSGSFIFQADVNNLDWRLVPAITGVESTFGKNIPNGSYNAYGWANGKYAFESWDDSITQVSKTLKDKYYDRGLTTTPEIARVYAPPSKTWAYKVDYFMNKIDTLPVNFDL